MYLWRHFGYLSLKFQGVDIGNIGMVEMDGPIFFFQKILLVKVFDGCNLTIVLYNSLDYVLLSMDCQKLANELIY